MGDDVVAVELRVVAETGRLMEFMGFLDTIFRAVRRELASRLVVVMAAAGEAILVWLHLQLLDALFARVIHVVAFKQLFEEDTVEKLSCFLHEFLSGVDSDD